MKSTLKKLNPLTNIFTEPPDTSKYNHVFRIIPVTCLTEIINIYKSAKVNTPNQHLIFIFESFRFCLCFVFLKDEKINVELLKDKLEGHDHNQVSVIPGLFCSLYNNTVEIHYRQVKQQLKPIISGKKFFKEIFGQYNFNQSVSARDKLKKYLFWLDHKKKQDFYVNNLPTFMNSNIFGGFINDILIKIIQKNAKLTFDLFILNLQERLDRTKDLGTTKLISVFSN